MQPKISVVIPLYNKQDEIGRCMRSVLAQTFGDFEVVVIDDGSTDASAERVAEFSDPRIRLIRQANGGVALARNRAIEEARAELIAFLDGDDEWLPTHLENLMLLVKSAPQAGLYFTAYWIDRGGGMRRRVRLPRRHVRASGVVKDYFSAPDGAMSLPTASMVRKAAILAAGGFRQMFGEDVDLYLRLAAMYPAAYSPKAAAVWHIDAGNRRCVDQSATVKLYEPGSLRQSLEFLAANPAVKPEMQGKARTYVARRELRAVWGTLLAGQRNHARWLLSEWRREYGNGAPALELLIGFAPGGLLRLWARVRALAGKANTAAAYACAWAANRRTFGNDDLERALSN